jgi:2Fe-2S ferredoxin
MIEIHYILKDGSTRLVTGNAGESVMALALREDVPGIEADCGGACSCATCHVYVEDGWISRLRPADEYEDNMLDHVASPRRPESRLSCQILLDQELSGLVVRIPPLQFT